MSMIDIPFIDMAMPDGERRKSERRQDTCKPELCEYITGVQEQVEALKQQLEATTAKIHCIETNLDENTKATDEIRKATTEVLEIIQMGKGFFRAVGWIGKWLRRIVMWVVPPVVAIIGLWQSLKTK